MTIHHTQDNTARGTVDDAVSKFRAKPSWQSMYDTLTEWHSECCDDPEYLWIKQSFEDMANTVSHAMTCAAEPQDMTPDNTWLDRQPRGE